MLVLSFPTAFVPRCRPGVVGPPGGGTPSILALSTLSGSDSRLPPHSEEGARARTEASVSKERRRRRLDEDASVRIDALSVRRLLAVAMAYVVGWPVAELPDGVRCDGMAEAGDVVGNGWLKWITWEPPPPACRCDCWVLLLFPVVELWFWAAVPPLGAIDCIVVRVVVKERTDGAGDEKVLSPPRREESKPQFTVRLVPASDEAPCEGAMIEREVS